MSFPKILFRQISPERTTKAPSTTRQSSVITEKPKRFTLAVPVKQEGGLEILKLYGVRERIEAKKEKIEPIQFGKQKIPLSITNLNGDSYLTPEINWDNMESYEKTDLMKQLTEKAKNTGTALNLKGAELTEVDLRGANLTGADLRGANLGWTDLREANLTRANLLNVGLDGTDLTGANLKDAQFDPLPDGFKPMSLWTRGQLLNFLLTRSALGELSGLRLSGLDFSNMELDHLSLVDSDLRGANLQGTSLYEANLRGANLTGADLGRASLIDTKLRGANLTDVNLIGAKWTQAKLDKPPKNFIPTREGLAKLSQNELLGFFKSCLDKNSLKCNLQNIDLSETNLQNLDLIRANLTGATLPTELKAYINLQNSKQAIGFLESVTELEQKYEIYKQIFSGFEANELQDLSVSLLNQLVEEENPTNNILSTLEKLYTPTNSPNPKDKVYPELAKALSNIKTPDIICWLIREMQNPDKQSRNLSIYALDFLSLLPKDTRVTYLNLLKNADNEQKQNIYSLLNEFSILVQNNRKLANKYLDSNGEFIRNEINKIIQSQSDSAEFLVQTIISNTPKPITNQIIEQYKKLNTLLNLNIPENNPKFITAINAQLHKNSQNLDTDKLKTFIKENDFKPTDNQRMDLFKKNINSIIQSSYMSAISESIESFDFITPEKTKTIVENISKNPSNLKRLMTFLGYMRHSQEENSGVIKEIYPIFEQYLTDINFPNLSTEQKAEIDKQLLKNFDERFKETYDYSWSKKMKELHPKFKANSIRGNFETKIGEYTFKAVSGTDAIFNGENVTSSQCTSVPGQSNGHLQMGLVGTSNVVWMEVRDNQGEMVSGFDIRILLDGGLVLGPAYKYNNKASIQENDRRILANEYLKHIGIASKIQLPKEIKTADPNTSKVGDVKSYHESGEVYY